LNGGDLGSFSGRPGQQISNQGEITNNLPVRILNPRISVSLSGNAVDADNVQPSRSGFYRSVDRTAEWNKSTDSTLQALASDETYAAAVDISTLSHTQDSASLTELVNPHVDVDVNAEAEQRARSDLDQTLSASRSYRLKLNTTPEIETSTLYGTGPFSTSGPIPPQANQRTVYTVNLKVTNTYNTLNGAKVVATVPGYAEWVGNTSSQDVSYDPNTRTVTWNVGEVQHQTGYGRPAKEAAVQVAITPSVNQVGTTPALLTDIKLTGMDNYTQRSLRTTGGQVTIDISSLPQYDLDDSEVVQ
jgi:hypothetical protein